mgnify:FL=1
MLTEYKGVVYDCFGIPKIVHDDIISQVINNHKNDQTIRKHFDYTKCIEKNT